MAKQKYGGPWPTIGTQDAVFERVFTTNFMKFLTTFDETFLTTIILTKHLVSIKSYNECDAGIVSTRAQHERR